MRQRNPLVTGCARHAARTLFKIVHLLFISDDSFRRNGQFTEKVYFFPVNLPLIIRFNSQIDVRHLTHAMIFSLSYCFFKVSRLKAFHEREFLQLPGHFNENFCHVIKSNLNNCEKLQGDYIVFVVKR